MGIFSFIHKSAVANYQDELRTLIDLYSSLDKKQLADYFVYSVWTRAGLQNEGHCKLPDGKASFSSGISYFMLSPLQTAVKALKKRGNVAEANALSIWVHTARGVVNQEMEDELKNLWRLIMSTNNYWNEHLSKLYEDDKNSGMDRDLLERTLALSKEILANVPPENFRWS